MQTKHRAVVAEDAGGHVRVLATNSPHIAHEIEVLSSDAEEIGLVDTHPFPEGIYLWEGTTTVINTGYGDEPYEYEMRFEGTLRELRDGAEIWDMLAMTPPKPEFDDCDRDSPGGLK